jgi:hypothetical protein
MSMYVSSEQTVIEKTVVGGLLTVSPISHPTSYLSPPLDKLRTLVLYSEPAWKNYADFCFGVEKIYGCGIEEEQKS